MILSNLSTPLLGIVDTAILGHLPQATHLAAVALGSSLVTFIFWSFGFLRMGTTSLTARAVGAGDALLEQATLARSAVLAVTIGVALWLLQWPLLPLLLGWLSQAGEVQNLALDYSRIRVLAAPVVLINYVLVGWFIGRQNTRVPLLLMVVLNVANVVFDLVLVWWLGWGSAGAAWASLTAELLALLVGWQLLRRALKSGFVVAGLTLRWREFRPLIIINSHLFVRTAALLLVFLFFTSQGARLGETVLAANAILMQLVGVVSYGLDGFAHAAEALVGRAAGARQRRQFVLACSITGQWAAVTALVTALVLWLLGPNLISLFTDLAPVAALARDYFIWLPLFPLLAGAAYHMDGIYIGWGRPDVMQYTMLASALLVFLPVWWLGSGNTALWLAFVAFNLSRGILLSGYLGHKLVKGAIWE